MSRNEDNFLVSPDLMDIVYQFKQMREQLRLIDMRLTTIEENHSQGLGRRLPDVIECSVRDRETDPAGEVPIGMCARAAGTSRAQ